MRAAAHPRRVDARARPRDSVVPIRARIGIVGKARVAVVLLTAAARGGATERSAEAIAVGHRCDRQHFWIRGRHRAGEVRVAVTSGDDVGHTGGRRVADRLVQGVAVAVPTVVVVRAAAAEAHIRDFDVQRTRVGGHPVDATDDLRPCAAARGVEHFHGVLQGPRHDADDSAASILRADRTGDMRAMSVVVLRRRRRRNAVLAAGRIQIWVAEVDPCIDNGDIDGARLASRRRRGGVDAPYARRRRVAGLQRHGPYRMHLLVRAHELHPWQPLNELHHTRRQSRRKALERRPEPELRLGVARLLDPGDLAIGVRYSVAQDDNVARPSLWGRLCRRTRDARNDGESHEEQQHY